MKYKYIVLTEKGILKKFPFLGEDTNARIEAKSKALNLIEEVKNKKNGTSWLDLNFCLEGEKYGAPISGEILKGDKYVVINDDTSIKKGFAREQSIYEKNGWSK
jgi:hypothetical protein